MYRARLVCPLPLLISEYQKDVNEKSEEILSSCEVHFSEEKTLLPPGQKGQKTVGL